MDGRRRHRGGRLAALLAAGMLACVGCGNTGAPAQEVGLASAAAATGSAVGTASGAGPAAPASGAAAAEDAIADAIRQRRQFGLRSDEAWVRQVAADPRARTQMLDFPMLPEEEQAFSANQADLESIAQAVTAYAVGHADEFGGVWLDQERHTVVAAWTANAELHRIGILAKLGRFGPLEVRLVAHSEKELTALQERLFADLSWYATIEARALSGGVMTMDNIVELDVSSANPDAPRLIMEHFGADASTLRVLSDGTGIVLQPRGTVHMTFVLANGKAPGRNAWALAWTPDRPGNGDCGDMVGYGVPEDGTFDLACSPGGWTIAVQEIVLDAWVDVGKGHVMVPAGGTADLRIVITPLANPAP
jgi:hypothetical protein